MLHRYSIFFWVSRTSGSRLVGARDNTVAPCHRRRGPGPGNCPTAPPLTSRQQRNTTRASASYTASAASPQAGGPRSRTAAVTRHVATARTIDGLSLTFAGRSVARSAGAGRLQSTPCVAPRQPEQGRQRGSGGALHAKPGDKKACARRFGRGHVRHVQVLHVVGLYELHYVVRPEILPTGVDAAPHSAAKEAPLFPRRAQAYVRQRGRDKTRGLPGGV